jgi:hypothetical protein
MNGVLAHCHIDLYLGDPAAALARLEESWPRIVRGRLPNAPFSNVTRLYLRARTRMAAAKADPALARKAFADCTRLESEAPWAAGLARSLRALGAPPERRGDELLAAARVCDEHALGLVAAACRFRAGEDPRHVAAREEARAWLEAQGVRAPGRLVRIFLPD